MAKTKSDEKKGAAALIEVPVADGVHEPLMFQLNMGKLAERHRLMLNRVWYALRQNHATLKDGSHVDSVQDVVRWMLDQVEDEIAA